MRLGVHGEGSLLIVCLAVVTGYSTHFNKPGATAHESLTMPLDSVWRTYASTYPQRPPGANAASPFISNLAFWP